MWNGSYCIFQVTQVSVHSWTTIWDTGCNSPHQHRGQPSLHHHGIASGTESQLRRGWYRVPVGRSKSRDHRRRRVDRDKGGRYALALHESASHLHTETKRRRRSVACQHFHAQFLHKHSQLPLPLLALRCCKWVWCCWVIHSAY